MNEHYKGLAHIGVYTKDMEKSVAFYEMLGGKKVATSQIEKPEGTRYLALVDFAGFTIELIDPSVAFHEGEGAVAHFAILVDDVLAAGKEIQALGVNTFRTPAPVTNPQVFGGVENWFFEGPSGEVIELMRKL